MQKILLYLLLLCATSCYVARNDEEQFYAELEGDAYVVRMGCMPTIFQSKVDSLWDVQYSQKRRAEELAAACQTLKSEGLDICECKDALKQIEIEATQTRRAIDRLIRRIPDKFKLR